MQIITWVNPDECEPPHKITHWDKYQQLVSEFQRDGCWGIDHDVLTGYYIGDKIQLISGSHRWAAAKEADIMVPVMIYDYDEIQESWGTERWVVNRERIPYISC